MRTSTKTSPSRTGAKSLLAALRAAVSSLPSSDEKEQIRLSCVAVRQFLNELEEAVAFIPSKDDLAAVNQALDRLEAVLARAKDNQYMTRLVGTKPSRRSGSKDQPLTEEEREKGRLIAEELRALPVEAIETKLQDEAAYSGREFRAIALAFGFSSVKGFSRESLARQIAVRIANSRGYRTLRGETSLPLGDVPARPS